MWGKRRRRERRREQKLDALARGRAWQRAMWEWQQVNPKTPVMEVEITRDTEMVRWNGPMPPPKT